MKESEVVANVCVPEIVRVYVYRAHNVNLLYVYAVLFEYFKNGFFVIAFPLYASDCIQNPISDTIYNILT